MHGVQFRNRIESWAKKLGRANMPSLTEEPSRRVDISPVKVIVYTTQIGGQSGRVNIKRNSHSVKQLRVIHSVKKFETTEIFDYFPAIHSRADYPRYVPARCEKKKKEHSLFATLTTSSIGKDLKERRVYRKNRLISRDIKNRSSSVERETDSWKLYI